MIGIEFEKANINTNFLLLMLKSITYENYIYFIHYKEISYITNTDFDNNNQVLANTFKK